MPILPVADAPRTPQQTDEARFAQPTSLEACADLFSYINEQDALAPCQPAPDLPFTEQDIAFCAATAKHISGWPLTHTPQIFAPAFLDYGICIAKDTISTNSSVIFEERALAYQTMANDVTAAPAAYLRTNNQIVMHPWCKPVLDRFGDNYAAKSLLVHEMTHAIQAESFPALFDRMDVLRNASLDIAERPITSLGDFWAIRKSVKKLIAKSLPLTVLLEGHATWVQNAACASVLPKKQSLLHRLGYGLMQLNYTTGTWLGQHYAYDAGCDLIGAVKALQKELEEKPFFDHAGHVVTLAERLQGDGILRLMFEHPHLVELGLPNIWTAWRPASQAKVDVGGLRELIIRMPGHTPLR